MTCKFIWHGRSNIFVLAIKSNRKCDKCELIVSLFQKKQKLNESRPNGSSIVAYVVSTSAAFSPVQVRCQEKMAGKFTFFSWQIEITNYLIEAKRDEAIWNKIRLKIELQI